MDVRRGLAQKTPSDVAWETALAASLYKVASAGDEPKVNLAEAHEILKRLSDAGTLWPSEKGWIAKVETALAEIKT